MTQANRFKQAGARLTRRLRGPAGRLLSLAVLRAATDFLKATAEVLNAAADFLDALAVLAGCC